MVSIVSTNMHTPGTEEVVEIKAEEDRSGLEIFFGRRSRTAASVSQAVESVVDHMKSMWLQPTWSQR